MVAFSQYLASAAAVVSLVSGVSCTPQDDAAITLEARQSGFLPVTGVTEGGVQPRLEIRDLEADTEMWNLFIQALEAYQSVGQEQRESFYQIAGIHGAPYSDWDGVSRTGNGGGYCTHGSNLFGTWHRPYLALFEQLLHQHAVNVANSFEDDAERERYLEIASRLRMPYWDWADPARTPIMPASVTSARVEVTRPDGQTETIANPLFRYKFDPIRASDFNNQQPFASWSTTKRWPTSSDVGATSQNAMVETQLASNMASYRTRVYNLLTRYAPYNLASNKGSGSQNGDNIESVHDFIHASFGGNAHMVWPHTAAFDPIFFFHHANVDRLVALWQAVYPDSFVEPFVNAGGTYTIQSGSTQGPNSPLTPFHNSATGSFWTSATVRRLDTFGYTYPELADRPSNQTLRSRINGLYAPQLAGVGASLVSSTTKRSTFNEPGHHDLVVTTSPQDVLQAYAAHITMPVNPLDETYSVAVFLGAFNPDPTTWAADPAYAGSHASIPMGRGVNTEVLVTGSVPLTDALLRKYVTGDLPALDEQSVMRYLRANLHWRAATAGQRPVPRRLLPGLRVQTMAAHVRPRGCDLEFPTYLNSTMVYGVFDHDNADPM